MHPVVVENAPGLVWRRRAKGNWTALWMARSDIIERGYTPRSARVWVGKEPTAEEIDFISDRCQSLQAEMLGWSRGGVPDAEFDGTVGHLIDLYQTDADSKYRKLRPCSRVYYISLCRRIRADHGNKRLADMKARDLHRWYEELQIPGKRNKKKIPQIAGAHATIGMFRTILGFGMTILESEDCTRLSVILHKMRFEMAKPRTEQLTAEHVVAIRAEAHRVGQHSIALASAFQFEVILRQKDVIGEWVDVSEAGISDVTYHGQKWLRGIRWENIDDQLVLRHITSKRQKPIEVNLLEAPMVMEELRLLPSIPKKGPIVVNDTTGLPHSADHFRRHWRKIATTVGVPKSIRNMDSRAGAISEATLAGAVLEHVQHAATHSDISMTQRYARGGVEKTAKVQAARSAYRAKNVT